MSTIAASHLLADGQVVAAEAFRVYPKRWHEVLDALGSLNDRFSVRVERVGQSWIVVRGTQRWTYVGNLNAAIAAAARLVETTTNLRGETFAQVAARLLDHPDPTHPDVITINARRAAATARGLVQTGK